MSDNPFDQFDSPLPSAPPSANASNPFDQFDGAPSKTSATSGPQMVGGVHGLGPLNDPVNSFLAFTQQEGRAHTFGLQDKVGALVPALNNSVASLWGSGNGQSFGQNYQTELQSERAAGNQYAQDNPIASKVATGIGTLSAITPQGMPGYLRALPGGMARNTVTGRFAPAMTFGNIAAPSTVGQAVTQGATLGGLDALGRAPDTTLSGDAKAVGAGILGGGGTAGIIQGALPAAMNGVRWLGDTLMQHHGGPTGLAIAAIEGLHNPLETLGAVGGAASLYGLSRIPAWAWQRAQTLAPLISGKAGGLLSQYATAQAPQ